MALYLEFCRLDDSRWESGIVFLAATDVDLPLVRSVSALRHGALMHSTLDGSQGEVTRSSRVAAVRVGVGVAASCASCQLDKPVEDAELEFELHAVDEWFPRGLDFEEVREFETEDAEVEEDDYDVDNYEVSKDNASAVVADCSLKSEHPESLVEIQSRDDEFLSDEDAELDLFVD